MFRSNSVSTRLETKIAFELDDVVARHHDRSNDTVPPELVAV